MTRTAAPTGDAAAARKRNKAIQSVRSCVIRALLKDYRHHVEDATYRTVCMGIDVALWNEMEKTHLTHFRMRNDKGVLEYLYDHSTGHVKRHIAEGDIAEQLKQEILVLISITIELVEKRIVH